MCRYLYADQVIGNTFFELIKQGKREISLTCLLRIERGLDHELRKNNNTVIYLSSQEIFEAVEEYSSIFMLESNSLSLRSSIKNEDAESLLFDYFQAGLPSDINNTIRTTIPNLVGAIFGG